MLDVIIRAGTNLYRAMLAVFNNLFYSPIGQWGFFNLLGDPEFYITLIGLLIASGVIKKAIGMLI